MKASDAAPACYKGIYKNLGKFEDEVLDFYTGGDRVKRTVTGPAAYDQELQKVIEEKTEALKNPFRDQHIWIKGEILDSKGMIDALQGRENQITKQAKMEESRRTKQSELDKLTLGKSTMKSFFKSKSSKEKDMLNYQASIDELNINIEEQRNLINYLTVYHGQVAIQKFKQLKMAQYMKLLYHISVKEITNAHMAATLNHLVLRLNEQTQ